MDISAIKTAVKSIPSKAYGAVNSVGSTSISGLKTAGQFISKHTPETIKNIKIPAVVDTFVSTAKEKTPEFVKTSANFVKNHKDTFVGGTVILAAVACAASIIKAVVNKIQEAKPQGAHLINKNKIAEHQG